MTVTSSMWFTLSVYFVLITYWADGFHHIHSRRPLFRRSWMLRQNVNSAVEVAASPSFSMYTTNIKEHSSFLRSVVPDCNTVEVLDAADGKSERPSPRNSVFCMFESDGPLSSTAEETRKLCKYTLYIPNNITSVGAVKADLGRFVSNLHTSRQPLMSAVQQTERAITTRLNAGDWSHFLCLTYPSVDLAVPHIEELTTGVDAIELRVDLLHNATSPSLHRQIALLRSVCSLPIIFTVRTKAQLGAFPDANTTQVCELLTEGLRAGVEYIDIEATRPQHIITHLTTLVRTTYPNTRIIGSLHTVEVPTLPQLQQMYTDCALNNTADIVKVVTGANTIDDCIAIHTVGAQHKVPYIGLCIGSNGSYSRVLNKRFTPVTHPLLPAAVAGQLTAAQLLLQRLHHKLVTPQQYYLFGYPIQHSLSPRIHNNAFHKLLMPHNYVLCEKQHISQYSDVTNMHNSSGASVTIPYKEDVMLLLDEVRGAAVSIGAVNTVVVEYVTNTTAVMTTSATPTNTEHNTYGATPTAARKLVGYNTDHIGMLRPIQTLLQRQGHNTPVKGVGLVIGAGGTARAACYAIRELGLDLVVANRSPETAVLLAQRFSGTAVLMSELETLLDPAQLKVVISTLPAEANYTLPPALLQRKPVVLDVVYKPAKTALIQQAIDHGCLFVQGATMLLEQAVEQFELWHRRRAPRDAMSKAVFEGVEQLHC